MKKTLSNIAILIVIICSSKISFAQNSGSKALNKQIDTLKYLKETIVGRKAHFAKRSLSSILTELNLTVKSYMVNVSLRTKTKKPIYLTLYFEDTKTVSENFSNKITVPLVMVFFDNDIPQKEALDRLVRNDYRWTAEERNYYGSLTVNEIQGLR